MTDEQITQAAREICAAQAAKSDTPEMSRYMSGAWDHTVWMRLVERGIRKGIEQHEAFKQEVSDALVDYFGEHLVAEDGGDALASFIIPNPDPLAQTLGDFDGTLWEPEDVARFRAALEARGLEIREKGQ
jgi:hypothetical protein